MTKHPLVEQCRPGSYTCIPLYPCSTCKVNTKVHVKTPGNVFSSLRVEKSVRGSRAKRWIKSEGLKDYKEPNSLPWTTIENKIKLPKSLIHTGLCLFAIVAEKINLVYQNDHILQTMTYLKIYNALKQTKW